jgi:hypothetical protein
MARTIEIWTNEYESNPTLQEFRALPPDEREYLLEYIEEFSLACLCLDTDEEFYV